MDKALPFASLEQVMQEKARLDGARKYHSERLQRHFSALRDHQVRGVLLRDAASDMIRSWKPAKLLAGLVGGGSLSSALSSAIFRRGGLPRRALIFTASMILPFLLRRASSLSLDEIMDHVRTTMQRIRARMEDKELAGAEQDDD